MVARIEAFTYSGATMIADTKGSEVARLFETGAHFAQVRSRRHPSMKPFVLGARSRLEILDLSKTEEQLKAAKEALNSRGLPAPIDPFNGD